MLKNDKYILGLDIGGSSIKYGWGNCQFGLQHFSKRELHSKNLISLESAVNSILEEARVTGAWKQITAIGIGTPGTIDLSNGRITGVNPNLPFWTDIDPRTLVPPDIPMPVYVDNDANLMCLGEAWIRQSKELTIGLTVGSGIGCGMVFGGIIYHGAHGFAMEFGHTIVIPHGEPCTCGRKGCVEAYSSVDGLRNRIRRSFAGDAEIADLELSALLDLSRGNPDLAAIMDAGCESLCLGLANLIVLTDPALIVIGGGAMDAGLYDLLLMQERIYELLPLANRPKFRLEKAKEGNRAGVLGAIVMAENMLDRVSE